MKRKMSRMYLDYTGITGTYKVFTIIELLVVISIIVILVSLLLPALGKSKAFAYKTSCAGNMKNISWAMLEYTTDNNSFFIPVSYMASLGWEPGVLEGVWTWGVGFRDELYVKNNKIYVCPAVQKQTTETRKGYLSDLVKYPSINSRYQYVCYGYNMYYIGSSQSYGEPSYLPAKTNQISKPSETILAADTDARYRLDVPTVPSSYSNILDVHFESANVLWVDGHVNPQKQARYNLCWGDNNTTARKHLKRD